MRLGRSEQKRLERDALAAIRAGHPVIVGLSGAEINLSELCLLEIAATSSLPVVILDCVNCMIRLPRGELVDLGDPRNNNSDLRDPPDAEEPATI